MDKAFFEKLRASLPMQALPIFDELIKNRPKKGKERLQYNAFLRLFSYIKDQDVINALASYFLDKSDATVKKILIGYLSANSDKIEHHRLYSTAPRKF